MKLSEAILQAIRDEYGTGENVNQEDVAKIFHTKQEVVQRLMSGTRSAAGLRLETVEKMFPRMTFSLTGTVTGNGNVVNSHNNFLPGSDGALDRVLAAFMGDTDVPDAAKVKLFNLIQKEKAK